MPPQAAPDISSIQLKLLPETIMRSEPMLPRTTKAKRTFLFERSRSMIERFTSATTKPGVDKRNTETTVTSAIKLADSEHMKKRS
jgi:hypothetical protein